LALLAIICLICAIGDHFAEKYYFARSAPWEFGATLKDDNPSINGAVSFANGMITFQNVVPISLYISIEFVRLVQAGFIWGDDEIRYEPPDGGEPRRTSAKSWNLSDDLGQIEYIFSDKTGTLTQNSMLFRQCTIGGTVYKGDDDTPPEEIETSDADKGPGGDELVTTIDSVDSEGTKIASTSASSIEEGRKRSASNTTSVKDDGKKETKRPAEVLAPFRDTRLVNDLTTLPRDSPQSRLLTGFFINLALCNTVLASESEDGLISYKAQSPDEAALVQAAADVGFVFRGRDKNILRVQTPFNHDAVEEYELLNVLEFTSARKRMSVVVKKIPGRESQGEQQQQEVVEDGEKAEGKNKFLLLTKGADNVIFERLAPGNDELKEVTDTHLEEFANEGEQFTYRSSRLERFFFLTFDIGLRTLTLAYREIDEEEYYAWERDYHNAEVLVDGREAAIEEVSSRLEKNLILLGATAIEDKLQDGVPDTIAKLKRAGIKVWVATGDKLETAVAIGMSSNLLSRDMNLIIVRGGEYGLPNSTYEQMKRAICQFFPDGAAIVPLLENQPPDAEPVSTRSRPSLHLPRPSFQSRRSSGHLKRTQTVLSGVSDLLDEDNGRKPGGYGLVIDGSSLTHTFNEPWSKDLLLELATRCDAVICCRTSPLQKALIVTLVRDGLNAMCLAIGDGANDVS
jgi:phospholipid-translocating ATPase